MDSRNAVLKREFIERLKSELCNFFLKTGEDNDSFGPCTCLLRNIFWNLGFLQKQGDICNAFYSTQCTQSTNAEDNAQTFQYFYRMAIAGLLEYKYLCPHVFSEDDYSKLTPLGHVQHRIEKSPELFKNRHLIEFENAVYKTMEMNFARHMAEPKAFQYVLVPQHLDQLIQKGMAIDSLLQRKRKFGMDVVLIYDDKTNTKYWGDDLKIVTTEEIMRSGLLNYVEARLFLPPKSILDSSANKNIIMYNYSSSVKEYDRTLFRLKLGSILMKNLKKHLLDKAQSAQKMVKRLNY